jgi:hypothetical protein
VYRSLFLYDWFLWVYLLLPQALVPKGIIKFGFCGSGAGVGCEHFCGGFYFFF